MDQFESILTILSALAALIFVLAVAYVTMRWMGQKLPTQSVSRIIKVRDRVMVGQDKCLLVVEVGDKVMLIGMTSHAVEKLCELDDPQLILDAKVSNGQGFSAVFKDTLKKGWGFGSTSQGKGEEEER